MASIDFAQVAASFEAAAHSYEQTAYVQQYMAQQLAQKVAQLPLEEIFGARRCRILEIGCGPGNFTKLLLQRLQQKAASFYAAAPMAVNAAASAPMAVATTAPVGTAWEVELVCNDLSQAMLQHTYTQLQPWLSSRDGVEHEVPRGVAAEARAEREARGAGAVNDALGQTACGARVAAEEREARGAAEAREEGVAGVSRLLVHRVQLVQGNVLAAAVQARLKELGPFDVVVSNAVFQWLPQLTVALAQIRSYMRPQGYLAFSSFAQGTLAEFKFLQGATHGLRYLSAAEVKQAFVAAQWQLLSYAQEQVRHHFSSAREVLRHLQHTGVNALGQGRLSVGQMRELLRRYEEHFRSEQGVGLSWCFYVAIGQQRHSQSCGAKA